MDDCLKTWTPVAAPADAQPSGLWQVYTRADGTRQWAYKGQPAYRSSLDLAAGDVVILPAGTGHRAESASEDVLVVGAYPDGRDYDVRRGVPGERAEVYANLARVHRPRQDPVGGATGLIMTLWR